MGLHLSPELVAKILASSVPANRPAPSAAMVAFASQPVAVAPFTIDVSEAVFQSHVVRFARLQGFRAYHTHNSKRSNPGFPDLTMVRRGLTRGGGRVLYAELKKETGKVSLAQQNWIDDLRDAGQEVFVWRPSDWNAIVALLSR